MSSNRRALFGSSSSLFSSLASLGSASVGACTGGVCTVAAQTGTALAAGSSGLTGVIGASPTVIPSWVQSSLKVSSMADVLPWWMKLLIVALLFSTGLTVYQLNGRPFYALLAGAAGILSACAEMNWLPGGSPSVYPVLAFSLPVLILVPWLPRLHLSQSSLRKLGILVALIAASGLVLVLALQYIWGWQPCALCWGQRIAALLILVGMLPMVLNWGGHSASFKALLVSTFAAFFGWVAAFSQYLEVYRSQSAVEIVKVCSSLGSVSCSVAGSRDLFSIPIVDWSLGGFAVLWVLSLVVTAGSRT